MTRDEKLKLNTVTKKCQTCLFLSIGLVILLTLVKMVFSNRAATWGRDLESIKKQTFAIAKENRRLDQELAQKTGGLDNLAVMAKEKGFVDKPNYQYFTSGPTVAQKLP